LIEVILHLQLPDERLDPIKLLHRKMLQLQLQQDMSVKFQLVGLRSWQFWGG
jgi:hypothetical protein